MEANTLNAGTLSNMFLSGANRLEYKKEIINELNVFPVPDGDTGTNMSLTIMSAVREVNAVEEMDMKKLCKAISSGSLRGARGNSGVILSQLIRGFTKIVSEKDELTIPDLASALQKATESAYKAVMKPKEGTILTVAKGVADKATELSVSVNNLDEFLTAVINHAEYVLSQTPEMLPVLKQAGVVDSGGQGLLEVLKGAYAAFKGHAEDFEYSPNVEIEQKSTSTSENICGDINNYHYSVSFTINAADLTSSDSDELSEYVSEKGDIVSIDVNGDCINISAYADDPGVLISKAILYGEIENVNIFGRNNITVSRTSTVSAVKEQPISEEKVDTDEASKEVNEEKSDNVSSKSSDADSEDVSTKSIEADAEVLKESKASETSSESVSSTKIPTIMPSEPLKDMGFIAVSAGEGLDAIFKGLGVDYIITGGQTMNPSTDDMLKAIEQVNAQTIFILPNNKNIILAANQVQYLVEDREIIVIPTKTIPQGITALINFMPDLSAKENTDNMTEAIQKVKTGQITYAVRDTVINDLEIHQGNIMGIGDHDILAVGTIVENTASEMTDKMMFDDAELISIYYGLEVDEEIAGEFASELEQKYPNCDVELHFGGQPIYYYIISVE